MPKQDPLAALEDKIKKLQENYKQQLAELMNEIEKISNTARQRHKFNQKTSIPNKAVTKPPIKELDVTETCNTQYPRFNLQKHNSNKPETSLYIKKPAIAGTPIIHTKKDGTWYKDRPRNNQQLNQQKKIATKANIITCNQIRRQEPLLTVMALTLSS